jgi:Ribbon-helix-helix protein
MEKKTARLTVLMDPARKAAFELLCRTQDITPSQVVRQLIRDFTAQHAPASGKRPAKKNGR